MVMPKYVIQSKIMTTKMKIAIIETGLVVIIAGKMMITMPKLIAIMVSDLAGVRIQRRCSGTLRFASRELTRHW